MRGFRFPVSSLQSDPLEKKVFLAASVSTKLNKDNKARPRSFFAARVFDRTTGEKPLVPRAGSGSTLI